MSPPPKVSEGRFSLDLYVRSRCFEQNGASRCTSELTIFKTGEIHCWDRAYDDEGNQVPFFLENFMFSFNLVNSNLERWLYKLSKRFYCRT